MLALYDNGRTCFVGGRFKLQTRGLTAGIRRS